MERHPQGKAPTFSEDGRMRLDCSSEGTNGPEIFISGLDENTVQDCKLAQKRLEDAFVMVGSSKVDLVCSNLGFTGVTLEYLNDDFIEYVQSLEASELRQFFIDVCYTHQGVTNIDVTSAYSASLYDDNNDGEPEVYGHYNCGISRILAKSAYLALKKCEKINLKISRSVNADSNANLGGAGQIIKVEEWPQHPNTFLVTCGKGVIETERNLRPTSCVDYQDESSQTDEEKSIEEVEKRDNNNCSNCDEAAPVTPEDTAKGGSLINKVYAQETSLDKSGLAKEKVTKGHYTIKGENVKNTSIDIVADKNIYYFFDNNANGVRDIGEKYLSNNDAKKLNLTVSKTADVKSYTLNTGWNLLSFPMVMQGENTSNVKKASDLINRINEKGANASHIATYRNGQFVIYSQRKNIDDKGVPFGTNFNVLPGEGYFIKNDQKADVTLSGKVVEGSLDINLSKGWNLVGIYNQDKANFKGFAVLKQMQSQDINADTLSKWQNGKYENLILDNGAEFGNDFKVFPTSGYWIRVSKGEKKTFTP